MTRQLVTIPEARRYRRRGSRLKWLILDLLAAPRERAIHNALLRDLADAVARGEVKAVLEPPPADPHLARWADGSLVFPDEGRS